MSGSRKYTMVNKNKQWKHKNGIKLNVYMEKVLSHKMQCNAKPYKHIFVDMLLWLANLIVISTFFSFIPTTHLSSIHLYVHLDLLWT